MTLPEIIGHLRAKQRILEAAIKELETLARLHSIAGTEPGRRGRKFMGKEERQESEPAHALLLGEPAESENSMTTKFSVGYHDNIDTIGEMESIYVRPIVETDCSTGPYYRVDIGPDLHIYMSEERLRELGRAIDAAPPMPKVNAAGATQSEDCAIAQPAAD